MVVLSSAFGAEAKEARNEKKKKLFDKWIEAKPRERKMSSVINSQ